MEIPFLDLGAAHSELSAEIDIAVQRVLRSGTYILGAEVDAFEREFAAFCGADHCSGVGNGHDALLLALYAMGIGPGDEVIVPSHTFIATWLAVSHCGAVPVPVEPSPGTFNMDPGNIERAITSKTKAVIPVHLYGQPADLDPILAVARRHKLRVLEDAAQAQGARYRGRRIGAHGDAVAWSFYPGKNLGAYGDAGAVTTNDTDLFERIRLVRNYGSRIKYQHEMIGFNSRLDPLQAAMLRVKLKHLDAWNKRRGEAARRYTDHLQDADITLPSVPDWADPVWHLYVVRVADRDAVQKVLSESGITTIIHYPIPPHRQKAYAFLGYGDGALPVADQLASEVLSLPMGPHLSREDQLYVIEKIRKALLR